MAQPSIRSRGASDNERQPKSAIDACAAEQESARKQELFKQSRRLADAERALQGKPTRKAQGDQHLDTDRSAC